MPILKSENIEINDLLWKFNDLWKTRISRSTIWYKETNNRQGHKLMKYKHRKQYKESTSLRAEL